MAHTRFSLGLTLGVLLLLACQEETPGVVFDDGQIQIAGKTLALGVPLKEWEEALGPAEIIDNGRNAHWPKHKFLAHLVLNACGTLVTVGGRVNLERDPELEPRTFDGLVRLHSCDLRSDTQLSGMTLDCGSWKSLGIGVLTRGRPFDFAYASDGAGISKTVSVTEELTPSVVEYSVSSEHIREYLGAELSPKDMKAFAESGACEKPLPKLKFEGELLTHDLKRLWRWMTG